MKNQHKNHHPHKAHHHNHHEHDNECDVHHHDKRDEYAIPFTELIKTVGPYIKISYLQYLAKDLWSINQLHPLYIYTIIFLLFSLAEIAIGFLKSVSLIVIFASIYSLHCTFHYMIQILTSVMRRKNMFHYNNGSDSENQNGKQFIPYSYGLGRVEVVLKFSNSVFAVFVGFSMFTESIHSLADEHTVQTATIVSVMAVLGLIINFIGVYMFSNTLHGSNFPSNAPLMHHHHHQQLNSSSRALSSSFFGSAQFKAPSNNCLTNIGKYYKPI